VSIFRTQQRFFSADKLDSLRSCRFFADLLSSLLRKWPASWIWFSHFNQSQSTRNYLPYSPQSKAKMNINKTAYIWSETIQLKRQFQKDLEKLTEWEKSWMMEFHPKKCEVISITRKQRPILHPYTLHGHLLKHTDTVKYLGVHISRDLQWDKHIDYITTKANSTLGFVRCNIKISNPQIKECAYNTLVRPILEYSQTVWDPHTSGGVAD